MSSARQDIELEDLRGLIGHALKNTYKAKDTDTKSEGFLLNCLRLFGKDYKFSVIPNSNGELCSQYPTKLVLLEYELSEAERGKHSDGRVEPMYDIGKLKEVLNQAKFARCRGRFAVPAILYEGKNVCRGATISTGAELYGRFSFDYISGQGTEGSQPDAEGNNEWQLFNRFRGQDIKLLKLLNIRYIQDLMVENKKVKFFMTVTSSEKVDKENRYSDFTIMSVPYPGCEFFRDWRDNGYRAEGLRFDWSQGYVDAELDLPGVSHPHLGIDWKRYKNWDLIELTQNYLRLMMHYLREGEGGVLLHCISGWDRTPLFVSLLRLSLWADGAVHKTLGPLEILYLTIAYDWYLFGHHFPDRMKKGEEIFFFCFYFLRYITSEEYSIVRNVPRRGKRTASHTDWELAGIDGVLLEEAEVVSNHSRGSNTSINSSSSLNSSVDNAPTMFRVGSPEDDFTLGGLDIDIDLDYDTLEDEPMESSLSYGSHPPAATYSSLQVASGRGPNGTRHTQSIPVPNPVSRRLSEAGRNNSACGSWQIISGSGSVRGSTSSHGSPKSSPKSSSSSSHNGSVPHESRPERRGSESRQESSETSSSPPVAEESRRKQRLEAVRSTFVNLYTTLQGPSEPRCSTEAASPSYPGLSSLFGNFAEKVGLKS